MDPTDISAVVSALNTREGDGPLLFDPAIPQYVLQDRLTFAALLSRSLGVPILYSPLAGEFVWLDTSALGDAIVQRAAAVKAASLVPATGLDPVVAAQQRPQVRQEGGTVAPTAQAQAVGPGTTTTAKP